VKLDTVFTELQKYPEVPFEVSVLADRQAYARDICLIIERSKNELIRSVEIVSVYEGNPVPEGKKSVSIKVTFASPERTLSPEEIDNLQQNVLMILDKKGYQLR
jgi:phenylalanyl-tRNA synthetase beta chain